MFRFADVFIADAGNVDHHDGSAGLSAELIDRFRLAGARTAVEETGEAAAEVTGLEAVHHLLEVVGLEQLSEAVDLLFYVRVVEHLLLGKVFRGGDCSAECFFLAYAVIHIFKQFHASFFGKLPSARIH